MVEEMASLRSTGFVDPGWEHGIAQDERKKKVRCNYCGKIVSGGIYRLKQHLARLSGEVTYCDKAPEEVCLKMRENLEGCRFGKKPRQIEYEEQGYLNFQSNDDVEEEEEQTGYRNKGKQLMGDKGLVINLAPLRSLGYVDPGWEHGVAQDERKKKVKCNYCEKIVSGGINRFKQHLARIPGEVAPCKNAPEEVYLKIKENMKWHRTGRRHRRPDAKEISAFYMHSDNEEEEDEEQLEDAHMSNERQLLGDKRSVKDLRRTYKGMSSGSGSEPFMKRPRLDTVVLKTPKSQMPASYKQVKMGSSKKSRKEAISAICKFFYHAGVPSHAANSPYFHKMLEMVGQYGQDLVGPSSRMISGRFLQDEILTIKNYLVEYKASWAVTGCSILADSWKDTQGRTLINFLVSCPRGIYFVSSIDATDIVEDATNLFELLDKVVEEMGVENVVQVITENTPSYQAAGKMLEDKRENLFWTPCASYCIDRMLEDFVKIKIVEECMEKGQKITKMIYNQIGLLNLMKKEFTGGRELLRPSVTQYASSFSTLQSLLDHRIGLKRMFQSNKWLSSRFSKSDEGKEVEKIVLNATFWKKMQYVRKSVDPIMDVFQKINSDESLSIPYIYNDMYRAKLAIKSNHGDDARKYGLFWSVIDNHWNPLFHHPLYLAAYFLNPSFRYRPDFVANPDVVRGLNSCVVRLEPDNGRRISASMQISDFGSAKADFGTDLAISTRSELNPAAWWQQHGINCLQLQRIAVRILSQTCSSFGCEHSWSIYDQIHSQRRNRSAQKRLNDFIYVHYNLRLRERQIRKRSNDSISLDSVLQESLLYDWMVDAEKQTLLEDEEVLYNEMDQADAYENDLIEYEDGNAEGKKGSLEMVTLADVEPLDVNPPRNAGTATDDDADLNFLDDDLSE
ncbi:Alanine--tRNA ligase [Actinidia chinensis var. chinensis]|uniref:Alanine--tRNA ligase n=1 Tax=Actinidia chinensis var. chinensis TaxID=1590841 RepID=A0A2R6PJD7_ACTCC|nr:Alanine--tRNA ligase [Actinidia chinensis var. chinensis]